VAKITKYLIVLVLFTMLTFGIVYASDSTEPLANLETVENYPYINQLLFESSRYTQTDDVSQQVLDDYHNLYTLSYTSLELDTLGFDLMFDTSEFAVYFEKDSFSLMVQNKETGYFWSSRPEFQGISGSREDNQANRRLMDSGLWVDYARAQNVSSSTITTASLYTLAEVNFANDASITPENPDHLRPYELELGSYLTRKVFVSIENRTASSFLTHVNIKELDVEFDVEISLKQGSLEVYIPSDSIVESGDLYRLMGIQVFPYFGAAREANVPGYLVIPDGVGALVRMNQRYNTYFQARFYGTDFGYQSQTLPQLTIPIYGMVHEPGANGYYVNILEGSETSTLLANFWGDSTKYNRISSRFNVRQIFKNVINKAGDGNETIAEEMTTSNYRISYHFLSSEDSSYVGIAKDYRDYLIGEDILSNQEKIVDGQIPIQLSYIMSDQEPSFIGTTKVTMTTIDQVKSAYDFFNSNGITNQQLTLMGWSKNGFVNRAPYQTRISGKGDYEDLADYVINDGNTIYLDNEYVVSSELSSRVLYNRDVAKNLSKLKMVINSRSLNGQITDLYLLYPNRSLALAEDDAPFFNNLGISGLSMGGLGSIVFSYYDGQNNSRSTSISFYQAIADLYDSLTLSRPNVYMYSYIDGYMDLPITNSQYDYYTDLVPLIPIILKGSLSYYTPYLNFNALAEDRYLTMVDFGINPSYILTSEQTYEMRYTPANVFYTTTLSDYEQQIIDTYQFVNDALKYVTGAFIENREVISTGLVLVTYSNGVKIYVNYNYTNQMDGLISISARSYKVVES